MPKTKIKDIVGLQNALDATGTTTYSNGVTGSASRTLISRLQEELWVEDFRGQGDSDDTVWDKAIAAMQSTFRPIRARGHYTFTRTHIIAGSYWNIISKDGLYFHGNISGFQRIDTTTTPDLSYPTTTNPGVLSGALFYFTTLIYGAYMEGVNFYDCRFGCAYLEPHNSPVFYNCEFSYSNVGVICYRGSQNYQFNGTNCTNIGNLFIGGATCFPTGTLYANQDNYFVDGLTIKNNSRLGAFKFDQQDAFDTWFVASILRPSVATYSDNVNGVVYPFADNHIYSTPTARAIFAPMRNPRGMFGTNISDVDMRGGSNRGFAILCLTSVLIECVIGGHLHFEGVWDSLPGGPDSTTTPYITIGAAKSVVVTSPFDNLGYLNLTHKFIVALEGVYTNIIKSKVVD